MHRAGLSLSAYNYDCSYGKKALMMMYKGIMEQVLLIDMNSNISASCQSFIVLTYLHQQDPLPVVPPGCSPEKPASIQEFLTKAKAALISVGVVRDTIIGMF